ncbi:MerR family transcriptional regulator [candidate division CSSED10-310 bacterium]|uniref:MerR family transcriptional regulator n=1 Tax=candidate division CSSED10-310 bacterium TaxID=2855610 RepID=A0ABV6YTG4_UNCC1
MRAPKTKRIRDVIEQTGVSRELIHHYLREGLIPKPESRAIYTDHHIRLLHQIKKLREDHGLPLDVIRTIFHYFDFDPVRLEPLTLSDSLRKRMIQFAEDGHILATESLTSEAVIRLAGITPERFEEYIRVHLIKPRDDNGQNGYALYDARIIALCEQGLALGIPFESFQTIGSYIRVGFELEHAVLFDVLQDSDREVRGILGEIFIRREVISSFIHNFLHSLIAQRIKDLITPSSQEVLTLDNVIYRPSPMFLKFHGLDEKIDQTQLSLSETPPQAFNWLQAVRILLHAGRYREALFYLEQALDHWGSDENLHKEYGRALILCGQHHKGEQVLLKLEKSIGSDFCTNILSALAIMGQFGRGQEPYDSIERSIVLRDRINAALEQAVSQKPLLRIEVQMLAGWLYTILPSSFQLMSNGLTLLMKTLRELEQDMMTEINFPGLWERYVVNTAYLLFDCIRRCQRQHLAEFPEGTVPSLENLKLLILRHDPACSFAETVFLFKHGAPKW